MRNAKTAEDAAIGILDTVFETMPFAPVARELE
jgi:hypothetical protein